MVQQLGDCLNQHPYAQDQKRKRGDDAHRFERNSLDKSVPQIDGGNVREQHANRGAKRDSNHRLLLRAQGNRRYLRLITDFDEEERNRRGKERSEARSLRFIVFELVRDESPGCHGDEADTDGDLKPFAVQ